MQFIYKTIKRGLSYSNQCGTIYGLQELTKRSLLSGRLDMFRVVVEGGLVILIAGNMLSIARSVHFTTMSKIKVSMHAYKETPTYTRTCAASV